MTGFVVQVGQPSQFGFHLELSRVVPLNSSANAGRQVPGIPNGAAPVVDVVWLGDGTGEADALGLVTGLGLVPVGVGVGLGDGEAEAVGPGAGVAVPPEVNVFTGERLRQVSRYLYATKAVYVPAGNVRLPDVNVVCEGPRLGAVAPGKSKWEPFADRTATVSACTRIVRAEWTFAVAFSWPLGDAERDSESTTTPVDGPDWPAQAALPTARVAKDSTRTESFLRAFSLRRCFEYLSIKWMTFRPPGVRQ
ncbi:hypothetical protein [Streptomyces lunaelactis]|uniref:hypothetical protein n=1 Tax=Streptomyces lunaelactis TaxID=1535768 RepID=UPI0020C7B87C|nr:hypothetical protein [Streptomyces lunaelactis]